MTSRLYQYAVPEGFPAMSVPVVEGTRYAKDDIVISLIEEKDLVRYADLLYTCFPDTWWQRHEPQELRPSHEERCKRMALRARVWLHSPNLRLYKATVTSTGEIAGVAGWHTPRQGSDGHVLPTVADVPNDFVPNQFRKDAVDGFDLASQLKCTPEEYADAWKGTLIDSWQGEFTGYDGDRKVYLGSRPHWYLAPFCVDEKYRGRGIGSLLFELPFREAGDLPLYLEALPNARPVYYRHGFKPVKGASWGALCRNPPADLEVEEP